MRITRALAPLGILPLPDAADAGVPLHGIDATTKTSTSITTPTGPRQAISAFRLCKDVALVRSAPGRAFNDSIVATCQNAGTAEYVNSLDLNHCVGIDPTSLDLGWARVGRLSSFCTACDLALDEERQGGRVIINGAVLSCTCGDAGKERYSSIRLDGGGIEDRDGVLVCRSNGRRATAIRMNPDAIWRAEPERCSKGEMGFLDCIPRGWDGKIIPLGGISKWGNKPNSWRGD